MSECEWMGGWMYERVCEWMGRWMYERVCEWMGDGWMIERVDGYMHT